MERSQVSENAATAATVADEAKSFERSLGRRDREKLDEYLTSVRELEQRIEKAERFKDEDKKKREVVEARNGADALIHSTEKSVKELGDKVAAGDKTAIEDAIAALKTAMSADNADEIKAKTLASGYVIFKGPLKDNKGNEVIAAGKEYGLKCVATEDVVTGALSYKRLMLGARILGKKLMPLAELGKPIGVMLPNASMAVIAMV